MPGKWAGCKAGRTTLREAALTPKKYLQAGRPVEPGARNTGTNISGAKNVQVEIFYSFVVLGIACRQDHAVFSCRRRDERIVGPHAVR